MAGTILYSANCRFAHDIAMKYRNGVHFVWCSEIYDPTTAPAGTPAAAIAPTSSPKGIYDNLYDEWDREDQHGPIIKRLKRSFRRLASEWFADRSIDQTQRDEIIALINSRSWKIWRPVLYIIPKQPIVTADRLIEVPRPGRAAYGPEYQIRDLLHTEFDIIER
jgi:hypothetical protein